MSANEGTFQHGLGRRSERAVGVSAHIPTRTRPQIACARRVLRLKMRLCVIVGANPVWRDPRHFLRRRASTSGWLTPAVACLISGVEGGCRLQVDHVHFSRSTVRRSGESIASLAKTPLRVTTMVFRIRYRHVHVKHRRSPRGEEPASVLTLMSCDDARRQPSLPALRAAAQCSPAQGPVHLAQPVVQASNCRP